MSCRARAALYRGEWVVLEMRGRVGVMSAISNGAAISDRLLAITGLVGEQMTEP